MIQMKEDLFCFPLYIKQLTSIMATQLLNPLRHLKGKLNHIRLPSIQLMRTIYLANYITPSASSLAQDDTVTVDAINELKSQTKNIDQRLYHKFEFEFMVHCQQMKFGEISTIFDALTPHELKVVYTVNKFCQKLNMRQLLYLNLILRKRLNNEYPNWSKLHLTPECPFKVQMEILPTLWAGSQVPELMSLGKRGVMKEVVKAKG